MNTEMLDDNVATDRKYVSSWPQALQYKIAEG